MLENLRSLVTATYAAIRHLLGAQEESLLGHPLPFDASRLEPYINMVLESIRARARDKNTKRWEEFSTQAAYGLSEGLEDEEKVQQLVVRILSEKFRNMGLKVRFDDVRVFHVQFPVAPHLIALTPDEYGRVVEVANQLIAKLLQIPPRYFRSEKVLTVLGRDLPGVAGITTNILEWELHYIKAELTGRGYNVSFKLNTPYPADWDFYPQWPAEVKEAMKQ